jgi:hypothetical protein
VDSVIVPTRLARADPNRGPVLLDHRIARVVGTDQLQEHIHASLAGDHRILLTRRVQRHARCDRLADVQVVLAMTSAAATGHRLLGDTHHALGKRKHGYDGVGRRNGPPVLIGRIVVVDGQGERRDFIRVAVIRDRTGLFTQRNQCAVHGTS